jgi:hypothetical protein
MTVQLILDAMQARLQFGQTGLKLALTLRK